ncbi:hypothetical protein Lalb_Chr18g0050731 [Lupinus albus]|uniref:Reverse transcriptase zinc-binding domain-containing protein n=1 Tax=Lupinus albus TaxID=3870 RepID=A0A6A4P681_LUPAL|nr:hypothetical protein Lalb_Chr18g0050731 [Lupinus albus]
MACLAWKIIMNTIPTNLNLLRRGTVGSNISTSFVLYGGSEESVNHIFYHAQSPITFDKKSILGLIFLLSLTKRLKYMSYTMKICCMWLRGRGRQIFHGL